MVNSFKVFDRPLDFFLSSTEHANADSGFGERLRLFINS